MLNKFFAGLVFMMCLNTIVCMDKEWQINTETDSHNNGSIAEYENNHNYGSNDTNSATNGSVNIQNQVEYQGRSAKSIDLDEVYKSYADREREPRIINDEKLSIKGFIPIVGFNNDKHDSDSEDKPTKNEENIDYERYANPNHFQHFSQSSNNQKHVARPEDQRFIGAALQGLTASLSGKPQRKQGFGYESNNHEFNSLGGSEGCVCVPFYMCKNGFLTEAKNTGVKSPNIQTAQSILNQFAIPAPQYIRRKQQQYQHKAPVPQNQFEQYLPIDERSNDDILSDSNQQTFSYSQNNSAPQYADEVLGRMLGVRSDGCGVLRTCCRKQQPFPAYPGPEITDFQSISGLLNPNAPAFQLSESNEFNKRFTNPFQQNVQQIPEYIKPLRPNKYEEQYSQKPYEAYPSQVVQSSYGFAPKPLNPFQQQYDTFPSRPISPQIPAPLKPEYPSLQPLRPAPVYPNYNPQPSPHSIDEIGSQSGLYGVCGKRHAVGIHGRVQNLQYHESSTEFGEYPWQVAILKRLGPADSLYVCGGALLSPVFVVTAAHCLKKFHPKDLKVRLGEWDVHREDEFYPYVEKYIEDIIIHPDFFSGSLLNDIALIKLDSPVDLSNSPHIAPVCLPEPHENFAGHRCFVSGWGKNSFGNQGEFQSVLTKVDVPVLNHGMCERALKNTRLGYSYRLHPSMVCAGGEPGKDACEGDGGSGLVCDDRGIWKVIGLVSWGVGCGKPGVPGVYTNIAYLKPWIDSYVERFGPEFGPPVDNYEMGYGVISERSSAQTLNNTQTDGLENRENKESLDSTTTTETTTKGPD